MGKTGWGIAAGGLIVLIATLVLMRGPQQASSPAGGTAVMIAVSHGITLDPTQSVDVESRMVLQLTERSLYACPAGAVEPALAAELPRVEKDRLTIKLRPGQVFADGSPIGVADVVSSLGAIARSGSPHAAVWNEWISGLEKTGEDELTVKTRKSGPFLLNLFCHTFTAIGKTSSEGRIGAGKYQRKKAGDGMIELASMDAALPPILLREFPDSAAAAQALRDGKVALDLAELSAAEDTPLTDGFERAPVDDHSLSTVFYSPRKGEQNRAVVDYLRGKIASEDFVRAFDPSARPTTEMLPNLPATSKPAAGPAAPAPKAVQVRFVTTNSAGADVLSQKLTALLEPGNIRLEHVVADGPELNQLLASRKADLWGAVVRSPYAWPYETVEACKRYSPDYLKYPKTNAALAKIEQASVAEAPALLQELNDALLEESYCIPVARQTLSIIARGSQAKAAAADLLGWVRTARGT